ncbi:hypothetical protein Pcinc_015596 [Petrolisthes cinctipes]|uniref:Uncharacterized protein n=1 Tax=Petrolisthes cinctipes TaxID=88211 RepID=A0AAE1F9H3_PETCI|nr:hypothetical protein Pcinc_024971 [Petrolisthes cinctipes]KAK3879870.1 hypothetical protein Pcinc_015596 [Petrolisthes cinctipes]
MDTASTSRVRQTDWTKCCLCQQNKPEELQSPQMNPTKSENDGYTNLSRNIPLFNAINALPIKFDPARFDAGSGIETILRENTAKYHHSCRLLFSNTKLKRAEKRLVQ